MTPRSDLLREMADRLDEALDMVAVLRESPRWTGPAGERFDHDLRSNRGVLREIADNVRTAAARMDRGLIG